MSGRNTTRPRKKIRKQNYNTNKSRGLRLGDGTRLVFQRLTFSPTIVRNEGEKSSSRSHRMRTNFHVAMKNVIEGFKNKYDPEDHTREIANISTKQLNKDSQRLAVQTCSAVALSWAREVLDMTPEQLNDRIRQRFKENKETLENINNRDDFVRAMLEDEETPFDVIPFAHPPPIICCKEFFICNLSTSEPCREGLRRCGGMLSPKTEEFTSCIGVGRYGLSAPLFEETLWRSFPIDVSISKSNYKSILEKPTCCLCRIMEATTFYHFLNITSRDYPPIIFLTLFNRIYPQMRQEMILKIPIVVNSTQEHVFLIKTPLFFDTLSIKDEKFDVSKIFL